MKEYKNAMEYLNKSAKMYKILDEGFNYSSKTPDYINYWKLICASELKDDKLAEQLANNQLDIKAADLLEYFPDLDKGIEWKIRWEMLGHCYMRAHPNLLYIFYAPKGWY